MRKKKIMTAVMAALLSVTTICGGINAYATESEAVYVGEDSFLEIEFGDEGCVYSILEDGTVRIDYYDSDRTEIVLPDEIDGKKVTAIGEYGLSENETVEKVVVPDGVTTIGNQAFKNCTNLKEVVLPESIESFGKSVFYNCDSLESIEIPAKATNIGSSMFSDCDNLKEVKIPESVTSIEMYAFSGCESLENVEIPANVTTIGEYAFRDCTNLKNVYLNEGLVTIEKYAFDGCKSIEQITIPESVTSLGNGAFYHCYNLKNVEILGSLTEISAHTFYECRSLESIAIPEGITIIESSAFYNCFGLKEAKLPETLTTIGHKAFYNCTNMKSIYIPRSVTTIDSFAVGYYEDEYWEDGENWLGSFPIKDFIVYGYKGTEAEQLDLMFTFVALDAEDETTEVEIEEATKETATEAETTTEKVAEVTTTENKTTEKVTEEEKATKEEIITEEVTTEQTTTSSTDNSGIKLEGVEDDVRLEVSASSDDEVKKANVAAKAVDALTGKELLVLDLKLYKGDKTVQPDGKIKITLPVTELFKNGEFVGVYRLDGDSLTFLGVSPVTDGYVTFETDHFSTYVFAKTSVAEDEIVQETEEETKIADKEDATVDGKTQTGDNTPVEAIIISIVALIGGVIIMSANKKVDIE